MNGLGRMSCAIDMGEPDMTPVFLRDLTLALDHVGMTTPEVCQDYDPLRACKAVVSLNSHLGQDAVVGCIHHIGMDIRSIGGEVVFPERGIPYIARHPLEDPSAIDSIDVPDPMDDPTLSRAIECYSLVSEAIGDSVGIVVNVEGPVTKAGTLRGIENLMMDIVQEPVYARRVIAMAADMASDLIRETQPHSNLGTFIAAATDNPDLIGEEAFLDISVPNIERLMGSIDGKVVLHPHGDLVSMPRALDACVDLGIDGLQFSEGNDLSAGKATIDGRCCTMGGIDAFTTLLLGPEGRIDAEVRECMEACGGGAYVFMCSCSLHRGLPMANVEAMMRSCRMHG